MPFPSPKRRGRAAMIFRRLFLSGSAVRLALFFLAVLLAVFAVRTGEYWKQLASEMALSDACDLVTLAVNDTVHRRLAEGGYGYDSFVHLEKDNSGAVTAITADMAAINGFSTQVLSETVAASEKGELDIRIPLGTLLGSNLTLGHGPQIPVRIMMLASSHADFRNALVSAGINQSRHQIILEMIVDVDIVVPWKTLSEQVVCQTLIAETVIVGKVPETMMTLE